ncbi:transposase [Alkalicoccobacillus porphyridii]|uniref:IS110 family transposase n=1 Tax=Alkalicoccobacillus porphyridii TaxID=2597270 RepID=A0A553ZU06_9BACI|nr:transposase [Alkalicoccobacillus porphyridii]TSB44796.1 IS110 family transposase [Alkalicoccobacillus porphyridii]
MVANHEMEWIIGQYEQIETALEEISVKMRELAQEIEAYQHLISIPSISEETVCDLLAETGPLTSYSHPRQLIKLAGLTLRENSSGQHQGRKSLSKRGRRGLRALLFRAVFPLIRNNQVFSDLYTYYISRSENPLKKKEAMVVLCSKLLKIFWGVSHHKVAFDAERMRNDCRPLQAKSPLAS